MSKKYFTILPGTATQWEMNRQAVIFLAKKYHNRQAATQKTELAREL